MFEINERRGPHLPRYEDHKVPLTPESLRYANERLRSGEAHLPYERESRRQAVDRGIRRARMSLREQGKPGTVAEYLSIAEEHIRQVMEMDSQRGNTPSF